MEHSRVVSYETGETLAPALIDRLVHLDLPPGTFLNVNFPNCTADEVGGTVVTAQGKLSYNLGIEERADGRGFPYYWLRFGRDMSELRDGTDIHAVKNNFVSVTPLKFDLTAHEVHDRLSKALA